MSNHHNRRKQSSRRLDIEIKDICIGQNTERVVLLKAAAQQRAKFEQLITALSEHYKSIELIRAVVGNYQPIYNSSRSLYLTIESKNGSLPAVRAEQVRIFCQRFWQ